MNIVRITLFIILFLGLISQIPYLKRFIVCMYTAIRYAWIIHKCETGCRWDESGNTPCDLHKEKLDKLERIGKKNQ